MFAGVDPVTPLLGRHLFRNEVGPTTRNVQRGYLDVLRYLDPDAYLVVRDGAVMNHHLHRGQKGGVGRAVNGWTYLIPPTTRESCAGAVD